MAKKNPRGVIIRHDTAKSQLVLAPIMSRPINYTTNPNVCNHCAVVHPVKTIHIWLGPNGETIIGPGVLEELQKGNAMAGFTVVGETKNPPGLIIGKGGEREKQDQKHRKLQVNPYVKVGK